MYPTISHTYEYGYVVYTEEGITISPRYSKYNQLIPWSNIDFISPIPGVGFEDERWRTYDGKDLMALDALEQQGYFIIQVGFKNRHLPHMRMSLWQSILFHMHFPDMRLLYEADDTPSPTKGYIQYTIKKGTLNCPLADLLALFKQYSRYSIICSD